ncbi:rho guanine nucleotide exchange factor 11-like [Zonotrichia leucophrys gambelii]|uniref:rho guanine nucleotide exchange factor 11-like n=1 Tax=Zonotrichia leucophrys gambelii TaxID=257770 RepID=UPI003140279D
MSVRPPQAPDRLSSLPPSLEAPSERRSPGHPRPAPDSGDSAGLVQRCVIIQRDQHGFGFTVSGDRVVLVQSVRPGGAAMRAGVQEGDRILKVNGTMVSNSSHLEVVKLIKSGAYVALTLLGSPPGAGAAPGSRPEPEPEPAGAPPAPPQRITEPRPLQDPEVQKHAAQILRNMLRQEEAEFQRFQELLQRQPGAGAALEEQLEGARRRLSQLQLKVLQETRGTAPLKVLQETRGTAPVRNGNVRENNRECAGKYRECAGWVRLSQLQLKVLQETRGTAPVRNGNVRENTGNVRE